MRKIFAVVGLALVLSGCAVAEAETPAQRVYAAQATYNGLLSVALKYESLPRCPAGEIKPTCSAPKVVAEIRKADNSAFAALTQAQKIVRDPTATATTMNLAVSAVSGALSVFRTTLLTYNLYKE